MEKSRIRDKHPGSATLIETIIAASFNEMHGYSIMNSKILCPLYCVSLYQSWSNTLPSLHCGVVLFLWISKLRSKENSHIFFPYIISPLILTVMIISLQIYKVILHTPLAPDANPDGKGYLIASKFLTYWKKVTLVSMYYLFFGEGGDHRGWGQIRHLRPCHRRHSAQGWVRAAILFSYCCKFSLCKYAK